MVQTVDLVDADERIALPPPTTIKALESIPLAQRKQMVQVQQVASAMPKQVSTAVAGCDDEDVCFTWDPYRFHSLDGHG